MIALTSRAPLLGAVVLAIAAFFASSPRVEQAIGYHGYPRFVCNMGAPYYLVDAIGSHLLWSGSCAAVIRSPVGTLLAVVS